VSSNSFFPPTLFSSPRGLEKGGGKGRGLTPLLLFSPSRIEVERKKRKESICRLHLLPHHVSSSFCYPGSTRHRNEKGGKRRERPRAGRAAMVSPPAAHLEGPTQGRKKTSKAVSLTLPSAHSQDGKGEKGTPHRSTFPYFYAPLFTRNFAHQKGEKTAPHERPRAPHLHA